MNILCSKRPREEPVYVQKTLVRLNYVTHEMIQRCHYAREHADREQLLREETDEYRKLLHKLSLGPEFIVLTKQCRIWPL